MNDYSRLLHWSVLALSLCALHFTAMLTLLTTVGTIFGHYVITGGYNYLYICYMTVYRDALSLFRFKRTQFFLYRLKLNNISVPKLFQQLVAAHPEKPMFYYANDVWSFEQVEQFSNKIANYFIALGLKQGDEVALFMENRPEYVAIWLGLSKAGIVSALVNTNQRQKTLLHSLNVIDAKVIVFCDRLAHAVRDVAHEFAHKNVKFVCFDTLDRSTNCASSFGDSEEFVYVNGATPASGGGAPDDVSECENGTSTINITPTEFAFTSLNAVLATVSSEPPFERIRATNFADRLLYIYTSGTEGMPKAAVIKNCRFIWMGAAVKYMIDLQPDDVLYTSLPLYHLAGGTVGVCQTLTFGNTMAIRSKFSASNFWKDCIKYKCTVAQYIGEICRYLLAQPESVYDRTHSVRLMFGNGLRQSIWGEFVKRFNIGFIGELYGSTEGNVNIINVDNKEGACGFISQIAPFVYPATLVRIDEQTGEPVRDENGICVQARPGETGEFVGKIIENDPTRAFDGYANKEANKKKIMQNVFRKGDSAFASGDLLTLDEFGYLYFKDRCGDTYRWKGENVSTMEVEAIISNSCQLADCIVYGVDVPGCEGKAGMAAILDKNRTFNLDDLLTKLRLCLPVFMIPVFIRLVDFLEVTSTHKMPKVSFRKDGFDPSKIDDPLYMFDSKAFKYVKVDHKLYTNIIKGLVKL